MQVGQKLIFISHFVVQSGQILIVGSFLGLKWKSLLILFPHSLQNFADFLILLSHFEHIFTLLFEAAFKNLWLQDGQKLILISHFVVQSGQIFVFVSTTYFKNSIKLYC